MPFHFLLLHLQPHLHRRNRKDRRQAPTTVSLRTDDNGTPATWTLVLSSSKPLTGRTGLQSRRTLQLYWNHRRYHSLNRNTLPLPDKDSSQQQTTCLVGTPPLRLLLLLQRNHDETSREEARYSQEQTFASRTWTPTSVQSQPPKYWTPTLTPLDTDPHSLAENTLHLSSQPAADV